MDLKIKISKKKTNIIYFIIAFFMVSGFLINDLRFPRFIIYIADILNIWLFINAFHYYEKKKGYVCDREVIKPLTIIALFLMLSIISLIYNTSSIVTYLWGFRNYFRFFMFFFSCAVYITKNDFDKIVKMLYYLILPNIVVASYQYFVLKADGDHTGGLFGFVSGSSASLNIYLIIMCIYFALKYLRNECKLSQFAYIVSAAFYLAVIGELKVFFIEFIIIIALAFLLSKKASFKSVILVAGASFILIYANTSLNSIHEYTFRSDKSGGILSITNLMEYLSRDSGYVGDGDLNRFTAVQILHKMFFSNDLIGSLFGFGLGSADYSSSISFLQSQFYLNYNSLHYQWFSSSFLFIELGYIGVVLYLLFFILILCKGIKCFTRDNDNRFYGAFIIIMIPMCFVNFIYNISLRTESSGYLIFCILSVMYVLQKENNVFTNEKVGL